MTDTTTSGGGSRHRYDLSSALVIVDVQNDFADPAGSLSVRGGHATIPFIGAQIDQARSRGALVVFTQDWHPASTPHFAKDGGIWPVHCVAGTWGAAFHPDLPVGDGAVVRKGINGEDGYSGFGMRDPVSGVATPTPLADLLRNSGITRVIIAGLATDYCVVATALDSVAEGFDTCVLTEGIAGVDLEPGDSARAISRMAEAGVTVV